MKGVAVEVETTVQKNQFQGVIDWALSKGLRPEGEGDPTRGTADGRPICPKHGVAMDVHGKNTDTWYSHAVQRVPGGKEEWIYCKGRPGGDSPGWYLAMEE